MATHANARKAYCAARELPDLPCLVPIKPLLPTANRRATHCFLTLAGLHAAALRPRYRILPRVFLRQAWRFARTMQQKSEFLTQIFCITILRANSLVNRFTFGGLLLFKFQWIRVVYDLQAGTPLLADVVFSPSLILNRTCSISRRHPGRRP